MGRLEILFGVSLYAYLASVVICAVWFFWRNKGLWIAGMCVLGLALALQAVFIAGLGIAAGRPPFKDTFETLVFLVPDGVLLRVALSLQLEAPGAAGGHGVAFRYAVRLPHDAG